MTRVGGRFSMHATGVGLVLLAHAPAEVQERVLARRLTPYTEHTVTDPRELRRLLAGVRAEGYAVSDRMVSRDGLSVAAPVVDASGAVVAALSLVVLADPTVSVRSLATVVRTAARGVSRALGMPADLGAAPGDPPERLGESPAG